MNSDQNRRAAPQYSYLSDRFARHEIVFDIELEAIDVAIDCQIAGQGGDPSRKQDERRHQDAMQDFRCSSVQRQRWRHDGRGQ